jgi:hypothetical protein
MAEPKFDVEVPEQGISKSLSKDEILKFLEDEIAFCQRIERVVNQDLQFGQFGMGAQPAIINSAKKRCQSMRDAISKGQPNELNSYVQDAKAFRIIIGQGKIGERIEWLIARNLTNQAQWLFAVFSARDENSPWVAPFHAIARGNPALLAFSDLAAAQTARYHSELALANVAQNQKELTNFIGEKTKLIDQLVELYRKKLVIEEPANSWGHVAASKRRAWRLWLLIFAGLVIGPIGAVVYLWEPFSNAVTHLTTSATGTISLAGVAAISVPALLYAWLLKNVSRVFIQTLNLADDAAHRRALAITYLGLVENPKIELLETERAIVLNALFRPIPTQSGDEGPPAGLVDLIRTKNS